MKKAIFVIFFILLTSTIVWSSLFEDTKKLAEQGKAFAQFNLGRMYVEELDDIPQDYIKAKYWFTKSAEQGNANAQNYLGTMGNKKLLNIC